LECLRACTPRLHTQTEDIKFSIKWMALESITDGIFFREIRCGKVVCSNSRAGKESLLVDVITRLIPREYHADLVCLIGSGMQVIT